MINFKQLSIASSVKTKIVPNELWVTRMKLKFRIFDMWHIQCCVLFGSGNIFCETGPSYSQVLCTVDSDPLTNLRWRVIIFFKGEHQVQIVLPVFYQLFSKAFYSPNAGLYRLIQTFDVIVLCKRRVMRKYAHLVLHISLILSWHCICGLWIRQFLFFVGQNNNIDLYIMYIHVVSILKKSKCGQFLKQRS